MIIKLTEDETIILKSLIKEKLGYLEYKTMRISMKDEEKDGMLKDIKTLTLLTEKFT